VKDKGEKKKKKIVPFWERVRPKGKKVSKARRKTKKKKKDAEHYGPS